jgi:hypothetical protein
LDDATSLPPEGRNCQQPPGYHIQALNGVDGRAGLLELATFNKFGYHKRCLVLRFVVKAVVNDVLPHLRHNIQLQGEDFAVALDMLEDEMQRLGPVPPPGPPAGDASDTTPTSQRQDPTGHPEWIITQGRALCH